MKKTITMLSCAIMLLLSSACTQRMTDFTVISTKNVPLGSHAAVIHKANKRVKAKDTAHIVLCIPFGTPNMKEAIDRAIESYPGAIGLADGVVKNNYWNCLFYGQNSYIVEGTPIYEGTEVQEIVNQPQAVATTQQAVPTQKATSNQAPQEEENFAILFYHDVKHGDTLKSVAENYKVSVADIVRWNKLNNSELTPGTKLRIMLK